MRLVFMGSGHFACPVVQALLERPGDEVAAVVTQPDRPQGRNRKLGACPAKELALARGANVLAPEKIGDAVAALQALRPDLFVVADYGQYLPQSVLAIPPKSSINVHPSLLPKYRGAAPIPWAIANGETMTGITVQYVAKKMDSGDIVLQQEFEIGAEETAAELEARLSKAGAALAMRAVDLIRDGHVHATPQDEAAATYARKLAKEDGRIDWRLPARVLANRVRAFQPWPGSFCEPGSQKLKVLSARTATGGGTPGLVLGVSADGVTVATGEGALCLVTVQPEGGKLMPAADWARGRRIAAGQTFNV